MTNLLNLPGWNVLAVDNGPDETIITATYEKHPATCHKCGSVGNLLNNVLLKFGSTKLSVADLPDCEKRTTILVTRQRYRCRDCKATFVQPLPDVDDRGTMTRRLVGHIERESLRKTFVDSDSDIASRKEPSGTSFTLTSRGWKRPLPSRLPKCLG